MTTVNDGRPDFRNWLTTLAPFAVILGSVIVAWGALDSRITRIEAIVEINSRRINVLETTDNESRVQRATLQTIATDIAHRLDLLVSDVTDGRNQRIQMLREFGEMRATLENLRADLRRHDDAERQQPPSPRGQR